jgi:hypothetical protein
MDKTEGTKMLEYRLNVVCTEHGRKEVAEENMDRLSDAFFSTHPEVGAVIAANFHLGTLDATFSVDAKDANSAGPIGMDVFAEAADASGLEPTEVVEINVQAVDAHATAERLADELLPA